MSFQHLRSPLVILLLVNKVMVPAVQFDDQVGFVAVVVGDKSAERMLPPEFAAFQPAVSQIFPKEGFSIG